jgi:hypothetical protein
MRARAILAAAVLGAGGLAAAGRARAQAPDAGRVAGTVMVHAEVSRDSTENAEVRAGAFEAARQRGYEPGRGASKASGEEVDASRISTEADALQAIRRGFGVTLLVRIIRRGERDGKQILEISVASALGVETRSIEASAADTRQAVAAAAGELIDLLSGAAAPAGAPARPPAGAVSGGTSAARPDREELLVDPKAQQAAWAARGGSVFAYGVHALLTAVRTSDVQFTGQNPTTLAIDRGSESQFGFGAGLGLGLGLVVLPLPDPLQPGGSFVAFRFGAGLDLAMVFLRRPVGFRYDEDGELLASPEVEREAAAVLDLNVPFVAGVQLALGGYRARSAWRGLVLGAAWAPTLEIDDEIGSDAGDTRFNYAGFELTLDLARIEAAPEEMGRHRDAHLRLSALALPSLRDGEPSQASLRLGAAWY